jgi:hypothetical protein
MPFAIFNHYYLLSIVAERGQRIHFRQVTCVLSAHSAMKAQANGGVYAAPMRTCFRY